MAFMDNDTANVFYNLGKILIKHHSDSDIVALSRFKSFFGVSPLICAISWQYIKHTLSSDYTEVHLLWALLFLKCYNTESVNRSIVGCEEKTFRKRVWMIVDKLAFMKVVEWEDRKIRRNLGQTCFTSLDGVDFEINEPSPFSSRWYSHKFKAAGLRYEISLCIRTGFIVWAYGGYNCGEWSDLKIARELFVQFSGPNEKTLADKGYNDSTFFILPTQQNTQRHNEIMSRHETINKRIKQFNILTAPFQHNLSKHKICFHSIINLTQFALKYESPLFSVC